MPDRIQLGRNPVQIGQSMAHSDAIRTNGNGKPKRRWPAWILLLAFLLVSVESIIIALVFKGTLLILLAPGGVCWLRAMDLWRKMNKTVRFA